MHHFSSLGKKYLSRLSITSITLLLLTEAIPTALSFTDVRSGSPNAEAIESLQERGVVEGYADGTFKGGNDINRGEFLKIVLESRDDMEFSGSDCFPDVNDEWFAKYVCTAKAEGIVSGYPDTGRFEAGKFINFAEASKILSLAFKQEMQMASPDWYEPYVRALEGSKAIPPSIEKLDAKVTRGEMAEMLWRLTENVTNEPSKAYLNVKYPEISVNLASDTPQRAASCADLQAFREEAARSGGQAVFLTAPAAEGAAKSMDTSSRSYSETNVQVAGVDEGDIVKTDGTYLYHLGMQKVRIIKANPASDLSIVATIDFIDGNFSPQDLYLHGNRLIVIGSRWESGPVIMDSTGSPQVEKRMIAPGTDIWPGPFPYRPPRVEVRIYNVTDKAYPSLERTVALEGNIVSSRRIEDRLYLVANQSIYWGGPIPLRATEEELLPRIEDSAKGEEAVAPCDKVVILPHIPSPEYLTVAVIPLSNANTEVKREVVLGSAQNIYASLENLYVATTEWRYEWGPFAPGEDSERTNVYRFAFTDNGVSFAAKGSVPGHILNQFSMDEFDGSAGLTTFRIATTRNNWNAQGEQRSEAMDNNLYVLNRDMEVVGKIEEIAPGEQIYSVRFLGDRTYMVTFRTIDPLFVIDTSDPRNPKILGKLKIPGFSNYLHPYDDDHILGFGKEAVESKDGTFAWQQGMKIALFDVSDVENPKELHRVVIGDRGTDSPLLSNHKALLFDRERNLLTFPVSVFKLTEEQKRSGDPWNSYGTQSFQGAYVYDLTLDDGFDLRGTITHYDEEDRMKSGDMWYAYGKDIERIVRIDDSLLTISQGSVQSHNETSIEK
ncbi:MAG: beta-propeller domain-containing protein, partial [Patescibacteria group bacterium]